MKRSDALLLTVALAISLLLSELCLQILFRLQHNHWLFQGNQTFYVGSIIPVNDPRGYTLQPGYIDAMIEIGPEGFRGPLPDPRRDKVLCVLGDSVPFGADVAQSQTYPAALSRLLHSRGDCLTVLNAGVPSYNLRQAFERYHREVEPRVKPALLIIDAFNDISLLGHFGQAWTPDVNWGEKRWKMSWQLRPLAPVIRFCGNNIALFYYLSQGAQKLLAREDEYRNHPQDKLMEHLNALLRRELALLRRQGVIVVLCSANPFYYQSDNQANNAYLPLWEKYPRREALAPILTGYNALLKSMSEIFDGVYYFDSVSVMDHADRAKLYLDYVHYSPNGNKVMAEALVKFLNDCGIIQSICDK